jgi:signal transduction histidine kinase
MRMLADLVESAGGRLDVESAPGRGTAVRVEVAR